MADLDDSKVNNLEVGVIGSGSMGAVSHIRKVKALADVLGYDSPILRTWLSSGMFRYRQGGGQDSTQPGKRGQGGG